MGINIRHSKSVNTLGIIFLIIDHLNMFGRGYLAQAESLMNKLLAEVA